MAMPIGSNRRHGPMPKVSDSVDQDGGRTRDRTLDLSRVKGVPDLMFATA
jgi:hypothetical protein